MDHLIRGCRLGTTDFDRYCRLQPAAVLDIFQDAAAEHALLLGMGFEDMRRRGLAWVVLRIFYQQLAQPKLFDEVQITTWPHAPGMLDFGRDYRIDAADGTPLILGSSTWAVIDLESRKLVPAAEVGFPPDGVREEHLLPGRLRKLRDFPAEGEGILLRSQYTDMDLNGHVNNAKYANYVVNALRPGPEGTLESFQLDYHHEVMPDTALTLYTRQEDAALLCKGCDSEGTLMFTGRMTVKEETA